MVNTNQTMVALYRYDPFGNTLSESGILADTNVYRFSSKELTVAGYYYGYRFYDPGLQRWLNRDPLGEIGGFNLYMFVLNDPVTEIDPSGLQRGGRPPIDRYPRNPGPRRRIEPPGDRSEPEHGGEGEGEIDLLGDIERLWKKCFGPKPEYRPFPPGPPLYWPFNATDPLTVPPQSTPPYPGPMLRQAP
jgi:RHS repeat-associated protein